MNDNNKGLVNYWPISGSTIDVINAKDMTIVGNCRLIEDRFGNPDSAILIELGGYATIPSGIYFDPETGGFTIMVWIKLLSLDYHKIIIDVALGRDKDNIWFGFPPSTTQPYFFINNNNNIVRFTNPTGIELYEWSHLTLAVNGDIAKLYIDGELSGLQTGIAYRKIERTSNFIGGDNWGNRIHAVIDDLKIFNRGLDQSDIQSEMQKLEPYEQINNNTPITTINSTITTTIATTNAPITGNLFIC